MGSSSPSFVSMLLSIRFNSLVKPFIKIQSMRSHVYVEKNQVREIEVLSATKRMKCCNLVQFFFWKVYFYFQYTVL